MAFSPSRDRVFVRRVEAATKAASGILLPDAAPEGKRIFGIVS
jgi:co-chaperonin GroES (HSP10)